MTPEEKQASSQSKVNTITTLCKQLQVEPVAVQMVGQNGIIQMVVFFNDVEKYPEEKPVTDKPNDSQTSTPNDGEGGKKDGETTKED